ncbi:MAG TPA: energy transducer TonB [Terriglobales bacterium]|nr:energy transducer TonB [Terriglobales bacterium]
MQRRNGEAVVILGTPSEKVLYSAAFLGPFGYVEYALAKPSHDESKLLKMASDEGYNLRLVHWDSSRPITPWVHPEDSNAPADECNDSGRIMEQLQNQHLPEHVYRVGKGVTAPRAVITPDPDYPLNIRKKNIQGTVVLWVMVVEDGGVGGVTLKKSLSPELDRNAIEAVKKWKFKPALLNGNPVAAQVTIEVNFRLY